MINPILSKSFHHNHDPLAILRVPSFPWKVYPLLSRSPREIKFLFNSGMHLTPVSSVSTPSNMLILMVPIQRTLQALLFLKRTLPSKVFFKDSNQSLCGDIWKEQPKSRIHSFLASDSDTTNALDES